MSWHVNENNGFENLTIDSFLDTENVFKNPDVFKIDYIPNKFPHREKEIHKIGDLFTGIFKSINNNIWISGPTSTGKTHVLKKLVEDFQYYSDINNKKTKFIYSSARGKTISQFVRNLGKQIGLKVSKNRSISEMVDYIVENASQYKAINFIFDEIDKLKPTRAYPNPIDTILGTFSRLRETSEFKGDYMVTVATNNMKLFEELDDSTASSFAGDNIYFPEYDATQISQILWERCRKGFVEYSINKDLVRKLGALMRQRCQDMRMGLRILARAGMEAEKDSGKIMDKHVKRAREIVEKNKLYETVSSLNDTQRTLLLSMAKVQKNERNNGGNVTTKKVYDWYEQLSMQHGVEPLNFRYVMESIVPTLESIGLITSDIGSRGRGKGTFKQFFVMDDVDEIEKITERTLNS